MRNQEEYEEALRLMNSCPLCDPEKYNNTVIERSSYSLVMKNKFPYCPKHLMICPLEHKVDLYELTKEEWGDITFLITKYSTADSELYVKNRGDSVKHLHFHLIVPEESNGFIYSQKFKSKQRR